MEVERQKVGWYKQGRQRCMMGVDGTQMNGK